MHENKRKRDSNETKIFSRAIKTLVRYCMCLCVCVTKIFFFVSFHFNFIVSSPAPLTPKKKSSATFKTKDVCVMMKKWKNKKKCWWLDHFVTPPNIMTKYYLWPNDQQYCLNKTIINGQQTQTHTHTYTAQSTSSWMAIKPVFSFFISFIHRYTNGFFVSRPTFTFGNLFFLFLIIFDWF